MLLYMCSLYVYVCVLCSFFFFKQKTAYEMHISDWSSDVCSSDLSLGRYKASIAKIHQLLDLKDPTQAELVKLRLRAIRREKGTAQAQARPLRFKGPVRDVVRDTPRGINVRALLEACADDIPGLRDRALLSVAYDSGLRASELPAGEVEDRKSTRLNSSH